MTATIELTPAAAALLRKFRLRHDRKDAIADWRRAERANKPACAFVALALHPASLDSLDTLAAHALARAACEYAAQIRELAPDPEKSSAGAAALVVSATAAAWTAKHKLFKPAVERTAGRSPPAPTGILREIWDSARRGFPQYDEKTAGICFLAVTQLGLEGLEQLDSPELLTLGACRYIAWSASGRLRSGTPVEEQDAAGALSAIQLWSKSRDAPVMHVSYTGRRGTPSQQALSLARDAAACAELAERRTDLVPRAGVKAWRQAAERHAYAAVAMDTAAITELECDLAGRMAEHGARFAAAMEATDAQPARPVAMPLFPPGAAIAEPGTVRASLRRLLPQAPIPQASIPRAPIPQAPIPRARAA